MKSPDYDWELIKTRLDQLRELRRSNKGQSAMIFALRTSLARNLGDMGNPKANNHMEEIYIYTYNIMLIPHYSCIHIHV